MRKERERRSCLGGFNEATQRERLGKRWARDSERSNKFWKMEMQRVQLTKSGRTQWRSYANCARKKAICQVRKMNAEDVLWFALLDDYYDVQNGSRMFFYQRTSGSVVGPLWFKWRLQVLNRFLCPRVILGDFLIRVVKDEWRCEWQRALVELYANLPYSFNFFSAFEVLSWLNQVGWPLRTWRWSPRSHWKLWFWILSHVLFVTFRSLLGEILTVCCAELQSLIERQPLFIILIKFHSLYRLGLY